MLVLLSCTAPAADGASIQDWRTRAEATGFEATSGYDETIAFLRGLESICPSIHLTSFGTSAQGRSMPLVIVSKDRAFTPGAAACGAKPVLLIQSGIHAGEIDGKDATLMILRDLALGQRPDLLEAAILLFVPIYNVDGHERVSAYNRPNQDGPRAGMGFRTTACGLDLNRDHLKLVSPEARALIGLWNGWRPHLHVDNHVTDGSDHDWEITFAWAEAPQIAPSMDAWLRGHMPRVLHEIQTAGHRWGPYVALKDASDPTAGFSSWIGGPRYSTSYFPLRGRASILVETHAHKPFRQRVLANRDFLIALIREVGRDPESLLGSVAAAEAHTAAQGAADAPPSSVALAFAESPDADRISFPVYDWSVEPSVVTGDRVLRYKPGKVREIRVPWFHKAVATKTIPRPRGYLVLPGWPAIEERLTGHGLRLRRLDAPKEFEVETMRVASPQFAHNTYQGLTQVTATVMRLPERRILPAGTLLVPADQPDFEVAVQLLEPDAPDSLFSWGLLSTVLEPKEWIDAGVLESLALRSLEDTGIAAEWRTALENGAFEKNGEARFLWWYQHTPYWDDQSGLLPVMRLLKAP